MTRAYCRLTKKVLAVGVALAVEAFGGLCFAHQPHDAVRSVAVSPDFQSDGTLLLIRDEIVTLYKSVDGGRTYYAPTDPVTNKELTVVRFSPDFASDRTAFVGTETEGLFRSLDAGETWAGIGAGLTDSHVTALAAAPGFSTNSVLFVGTGTGKLFRSPDGGVNVTEVAALPGEISAFAVSPAFAQDGTIFVGVRGGGVAQSVDGGFTWEWRNSGLTDLQVSSLAVSPQYTKDHLVLAGTSGGVFRTTNGGTSWQAANTGIRDLAITDVQIAPTRAAFAVAATDGAYRSQDGGATWVRFTHGMPRASPQTTVHFRELAISPDFLGDGTVFVGMFEGLYESKDKGESWRETNFLPIKTNRHVAISPNYGADQAFFAGTLGGGLLETRDGGTTWEPKNIGLKNTYLDPVTLSPDFSQDHTVFLGTVDGLFRSWDGGATWTLSSLVPGKTIYVRELAPSPTYSVDRVVFASTETSMGVFRSDDGGDTWTQGKAGFPLYHNIRALEVSPAFSVDHAVFAGLKSYGVFMSVDGGGSWAPAGTGIGYRTVEAIGVSPAFAQDGTVFAGTTDGLFVSRDGATSWTAVDTGNHGYTTFNNVAFSPEYAVDRTVFVSVLQGGLRKSIDAGVTWTDASSGILPNIVRSLVVSPNYGSDQTLFAGTETGVYRSTDGGSSWQKVQSFNRYEAHPDLMDFVGTWRTKNDDRLSGASLHHSEAAGSRCVFDFEGTTATWIGTKGPNHGRAELYVDGTLVDTLDLYSPQYLFSVPIRAVGSLAPTWHRLEVRVLGQKNSASRGVAVTIDAIDVND